jgi:TRAP transporter TAXI family solute receptor
VRKLARLSAVVALAVAVAMIVYAFNWYNTHETLPQEIRIASGRGGGLYHTITQHFAKHLEQRTGRPVRVIESDGSEANIDLLRNGGADLALIQTFSATPSGGAGIAPLYPEMLHFIARKGKGIQSPKDLEGKRVALGLKGSAMLQTSRTVLAHYDVKNVQDREEYFSALDTDPNVDAALVTTGWMNPSLEKLLQRVDFELIGINDPEGLAMRHPWFTATSIPRGLYSGKSPVPPNPVRTVAVTALLTCRSDAPDRLVREALAALYETDLRSSFPAVLSAKAAKDYDAAVMHPSVAKYHDPSAELNRLSKALELIAKSKEALFGVCAFAFVIWGWIRRRREQIQAAKDQVQKQKLDEYISRTLTVELEQMDVSDPEHLRPFLRRVTHIKQEALRELTSEKVRGDQLFSIFLSQCAALSEKIQMRMIYGRISEATNQAWDGGLRAP